MPGRYAHPARRGHDLAVRSTAVASRSSSTTRTRPRHGLRRRPPSQAQRLTLLWPRSANAASASIDQGSRQGGSRRGLALTVCPTTATQYTIVAVGEARTRSASTTVSVTPPPAPDRVPLREPGHNPAGPVRDLVVVIRRTPPAPRSIRESARWISPGCARSALTTHDAILRSPRSARAEPRSASTTVSVTPPPAPTVSLSASPATIQQGQCATLTWSAA